MSNENHRKRMTFQGIFQAEKEKVPEKTSRSKSKSRSKVNSISKSINQSQLSNRSWRKYSPKKSTLTEPSDATPHSKTTQDNIFREKKKSVEQELMKKIIKLKNTSIKIDNSFKEQLNTTTRSNAPKSNLKQNQKFEDMQIFLEEFDVQIRKKVKEIGDSYIKQVENSKNMFQNEEIVPEYNYLPPPQISFEMPLLQAKLNQMEDRWMD